MEKEGKKFYREVEKEMTDGEEKKQKSEMKRIKKENFITKCYPTCMGSPGGTQKLVSRKRADIASTVGRRVGNLVTARCFDNPYVIIPNSNLTILRNKTHTVMHNINKESNSTQTSSGLPGGTDTRTFTLKPTNHRRDMNQRFSLKMIEYRSYLSVEIGDWF